MTSLDPGKQSKSRISSSQVTSQKSRRVPPTGLAMHIYGLSKHRNLSPQKRTEKGQARFDIEEQFSEGLCNDLNIGSWSRNKNYVRISMARGGRRENGREEHARTGSRSRFFRSERRNASRDIQLKQRVCMKGITWRRCFHRVG